MKKFEEFLNEDVSGFLDSRRFVSKDLALITVKHLIEKEDKLSRDIYLSLNDRQIISKEYGKILPRGFAGPENSYSTGALLASALFDNPSIDNQPYFDDADLVFDDWPDVYKCKVTNKQLDSTWKDLSDWLLSDYSNLDSTARLWLKSNLGWKDFIHKHRGHISGKNYGI